MGVHNLQRRRSDSDLLAYEGTEEDQDEGSGQQRMNDSTEMFVGSVPDGTREGAPGKKKTGSMVAQHSRNARGFVAVSVTEVDVLVPVSFGPKTPRFQNLSPCTHL